MRRIRDTLGRRWRKRRADRYEVEVGGESVSLPVPGLVADVPDSKKLLLEGQTLEGEEFSGGRLAVLSVQDCRLVRCRFERMVVGDASFGSGLLVSEYEECSFDGSRFSGAFGRARFVRCSFRDVTLKEVFGDDAEFIDCVFTGTADGVVFFGRPNRNLADVRHLAEVVSPHMSAEENEELQARIEVASQQTGQSCLDRPVNRFSGNDLSGLDMVDCDFRRGIDLTAQVLPDDPDYVLIEDLRAAVVRTRKDVALWQDDDDRQYALRVLRGLERDVDDGQQQALLRASHWRARGKADERLFGLLTGVH